MLCQPWSLDLHSYSVTVILIGLVGFSVFSKIKPGPDTALVVVDLQHDFLPGGPLGVAGGDEVVAPIARLAPAFTTVVATQDFRPEGHVSFAAAHPGRRPYTTLALPHGDQELWPDHCLRGSPGAALHPALPDGALTLVLRKGTRREVDSYSAFRENVGPDGRRPTASRRSTRTRDWDPRVARVPAAASMGSRARDDARGGPALPHQFRCRRAYSDHLDSVRAAADRSNRQRRRAVRP